MQQKVDNRYRLQQPLGSGGMADVFLAHDDILDRDVALKVMSVRYSGDDEFVERFKREAQSAAALSHPNIVSIFDRGEADDGTYYIAMEYLPGGTLKDRIVKRGAFPPRTAAAVALQIAEALKAAHERDVIHRDIKPHNILITDSGDVKVTDFGIARAASSSTMTRTGHILGTAHYISPEQAMGEPVGPASDLYSLGVVFYEMLTGEMPFDADTPLGIAMKHVNGHLVPPQVLNREIPDGVNAVAVRLLAKDPNDRYPNDAELIEDLERVSAGLDPAGATTEMQTAAMTVSSTRQGPPQPPRGTRPVKRRRRWLPVLLALLVLLVLVPLAWAGYNYVEDLRDDPPARIAVPNLAGSTLEGARDQVGNDFRIVEAGERDGEEPINTILEQDPQDGGQIAEGSEIRVTVASGQNALPDTTGTPRDEAERALEEAGFDARVREEESSPQDEGLVTEQSPSGDVADLASDVEIVVGTGPDTVPVPDVTGNNAAQAEGILAESDLQLGAVAREYSATAPEGTVVSQDPVGGENLEPDGAVDVTVSLGARPVEVPEVYGVPVAEAQALLEAEGLVVTPVESTLANTEPAGTALETEPVTGTSVDVGSTVTVYYSAGPPPEPTTTTPDASASPDPEGGNDGGAGNAEDGDDDENLGTGNGSNNVRENVQRNENVPGNGGGNGRGRGRGRGGDG